MDFRHVRAFITVADALSVTKAAERLHISQPPLSRHIHQLEEELGIVLFVRHRHGVSLTESGQLLLGKARALQAAASDFYDTARRAAEGGAGTIRVGIAWGLWEAVNRVRVEFSTRCPGVAIEARDVFCIDKCHDELRSHQLDVVFARPPFDGTLLDVTPIYEEPIQLAISDASPIASCARVGIRDIAGEPLLLWDRPVAPVLYDRILDLYARRGLAPTMIPTPGAGPFNNAGLMMVASGRGVYLCLGVPLTSPHAPSGVAVMPLSDDDATIDVCVARRKGDESPLLADFLQSVRCVFPQESDALTVLCQDRGFIPRSEGKGDPSSCPLV